MTPEPDPVRRQSSTEVTPATSSLVAADEPTAGGSSTGKGLGAETQVACVRGAGRSRDTGRFPACAPCSLPSTGVQDGTVTERNWAGNHTYTAARIERPSDVEALRELVAAGDRVKALGSRHSFSDIADTTGTLVSLEDLPVEVTIDEEARTASVTGGATYGALASALDARGWALGAMASLPHISVAGAVATGTHGSGDRNRSLAGAVCGLDIVGPDGDLRTLRRGDPDFDGSVVALGALGVVTRVEVDVEPTYSISQTAYTGLTWDALAESFDDVTSHGYSVSLFTTFDDAQVRQMWVKARSDAPPVEAFTGTVPATETLHMLEGAPTDAVTQQGGVPGPWFERLPHFRMEFTPSRGEEIQSEYLLPRENALAAVDALRRLQPGFGPLLQVAEIRSIAGDDLWLSGASGRDTVGLHFTWVRDTEAVLAAVAPMEEELLPLGARPHWGKVFAAGAADLAPLYPRLEDFRALRDRVDPERVFGNAFLDRVLG